MTDHVLHWLQATIALTGAVLLATATQGRAAELPAPLLHLDFRAVAGDTVRDVSGNGHDARLEGLDGRLPRIVDTPMGPALELLKDHGHGLRLPAAEELTCSDGLTVMAWVKPAGTRSHLAVFANAGDAVQGQSVNGYRLSVFWSRAFMEIGVGDAAGLRLSSPEWTVANQHWVHLAMTFDGVDMVLYVNAAEVARRRLPEPRRITPNRRPFTIGKYYWNDAYPFVGLIGTVRVYGVALGDQQVFAAASASLGP